MSTNTDIATHSGQRTTEGEEREENLPERKKLRALGQIYGTHEKELMFKTSTFEDEFKKFLNTVSNRKISWDSSAYQDKLDLLSRLALECYANIERISKFILRNVTEKASNIHHCAHVCSKIYAMERECNGGNPGESSRNMRKVFLSASQECLLRDFTPYDDYQACYNLLSFVSCLYCVEVFGFRLIEMSLGVICKKIRANPTSFHAECLRKMLSPQLICVYLLWMNKQEHNLIAYIVNTLKRDYQDGEAPPKAREIFDDLYKTYQDCWAKVKNMPEPEDWDKRMREQPGLRVMRMPPNKTIVVREFSRPDNAPSSSSTPAPSANNDPCQPSNSACDPRPSTSAAEMPSTSPSTSRIEAHQRKINMVKAGNDYKRYIAKIPKFGRKRSDPKTPQKKLPAKEFTAKLDEWEGRLRSMNN